MQYGPARHLFADTYRAPRRIFTLFRSSMNLKVKWPTGLLLGTLVATALASGCSQAEKSSPLEQVPAVHLQRALASPAQALVVSPAAAPAAVGPAAMAARLLIYHATVRLKTTALAHATASLDSLVRRSGGYLSAASEVRADGEWQQQTTIRVPPTQFQTLLSGLTGLGTVEEKKLTTDDVTAEHADVAARLQAKRAVERQYTALLSKAQKIKNILDIEEKLGEARAEIEGIESRLKTLNSEVAYSTISLTLYQPLPQSTPDAPVVSLSSRSLDAFYDGWQLLISLLLGILTLWPLVLVAGLVGWWLWRHKAHPKPTKSAPTAHA